MNAISVNNYKAAFCEDYILHYLIIFIKKTGKNNF